MKYFISVLLFFLMLGCSKDELLLTESLNSEVALKAELTFPHVLPLPNGFQPEGIVIGSQNEFFVGSLFDGKIYKGDLRTGDGDVFIDPVDFGLTPGPAVGLALDKRSGYLYVAGGFDLEPPFIGIIYVYDSRSGELVRRFTVDSPYPVFINDVIITRDTVYFTDSLAPFLYTIALSKNGKLPESDMLAVLPLTGFSTEPFWDDGFPFPIYGNGIDATPNGKMLIVGNLNRGELYLVNPMTGESELIDLGGEKLFYADGILLDGKTLYVVQNFFNQIAVVDLSNNMRTGMIIDYITDENLGIPSTIAGSGVYLYAVNAHFDQAAPGGPPVPDVEFEVVKLKK